MTYIYDNKNLFKKISKPTLDDYEVAALLTGDIDEDAIEIALYREYIEGKNK